MKKISFILISLFVLNFAGCIIKDKATELKEDVQKSYENIKEETEKVVEGVKETKEKTEKTISDIQNAVDKVNEAKDAIDEVTK